MYDSLPLGWLASLSSGHQAIWLACHLAVQSACRCAFLPSRWLAAFIACQHAGKWCKVPPMIIVVANSKGGVGKSTISVHLAAWLHEQGHSVLLADCDTQHSSSAWAKEAIPQVKTVRLSSGDDVLDQLPQLRHEADYIVADGPGSDIEMSRCLLLRADMAIVPCKASMLEIRALSQATKALKHAHDIRNGQPKAIIVLSMVGKQYRLTQDMKDAAATLGLRMAKTSLTLRQIYADAPGQEAVVWHMGSRGRDAAHEVRAFFREALPEACAAKPVRQQRKRAAG
jgi:chromosome partitioning protein